VSSPPLLVSSLYTVLTPLRLRISCPPVFRAWCLVDAVEWRLRSASQPSTLRLVDERDEDSSREILECRSSGHVSTTPQVRCSLFVDFLALLPVPLGVDDAFHLG
jgi:hypothetical protein